MFSSRSVAGLWPGMRFSSSAATPAEPVEPAASGAPAATPNGDIRRYFAWGTGAAVEICERDLRVMVAKVSPGGAQVLAVETVENFRERPAAEWGADVTRILKKSGAGHVALTVTLPRREMIVRTLALPGVADKDMGAALAYQADGLHPYGEGEAAYAWARIPKTPQVLVGLIRRETLDTYLTLLREAGLKIASLTFSAATLYSAVRLLLRPPAGFFAMTPTPDGFEVYGESGSHPVYSALFDMPEARAETLARSELRLPPETEGSTFGALLPKPKTSPIENDLTVEAPFLYAAALAGACPLFSLDANLLPPEMRSASSRWMFVPTILLAVLLAVALAAVPIEQHREDEKYLELLNREIAKYRPQAEAVSKLENQIAATRARVRLLDNVRKRTKADLDALNELTKLLPPPAWVYGLDMNRSTVIIAGESDQAVGLLKVLDASPLFQNSEFQQSLQRLAGNAEAFRIRTQREGQPE